MSYSYNQRKKARKRAFKELLKNKNIKPIYKAR
jgi:hypothetical protein